MALIRQYRKATDTVYVLDAERIYDPEKKQTRYVHRRLIGKVDPSSGEVIPTGKRGRPRKNPAAKNAQDEQEKVTASNGQTIAELTARIEQLQQELEASQEQIRSMNSIMQSIQRLLDMNKGNTNA